ncbi:MAG: NAD(P)H-binding protein [Solirubrobacteraceae bacterium]
MRILVTGVSGYVGAALVPRLRRAGHDVRGFARSRERVTAAGVQLDDVVVGDAISGAGLGRALDGVDAAYFLIHSMEGPPDGGFPEQERRAAERFATAARTAGVRRVVYLGGLVPPQGATVSRHLASRLAVEQALLEVADEPIALRASIVVGARSRSFRFLVRLIERLPVLALPAWRVNRTRPIDGRDVLDFLVRAADAPAALAGRSWDVAGPETMTYAEMIARIADAMLVDRPSFGVNATLTPLVSAVGAAIAGEDPGFIGPMMESLEHDLLPRHGDAAGAFGVRLHAFDAAVERALREWELTEEVAAK